MTVTDKEYQELIKMLQGIADKYLKEKKVPEVMYTEEGVMIDMNGLLLDFIPFVEENL